MSSPRNRTQRALIVHAHPEPRSFTTSQSQVARDALERGGYEVETIDLYGRAWQPVLDRSEFPPAADVFKPQREQQAAFRTGRLADDVAADLDRVLTADLLVLSFPLWWFSFPAILKGWLDRVFVMGAVSGGDAGVFETATLRGRRAVVLTTTGGPATAFTPDGEFGGIDEFLFPINRGVLEFVGYDALQPIVTYGPAHLDGDARAQALRAVDAAVKAIRDRPLATTSRRGRLVDLA